MKKLITTTVALAITFSGIAQTKLIEKVTRKGGELVIPYEKYQLGNGLTVLVHEDHSDPMVYVDVTYHVGSVREQEGRSGFAHFFEHMMFEGSEHVGKGKHFKILTNAGGTLNGSTTTDRTNYWEVVPSNQLETALWLESDRMGFLLDSVTQQKFENQRSTVKNERGQNYDNRPYGVVGEKINAAMYPPSHPYSWLTIGYIEDLNRVDVKDLKNFFLRWYGPNNATLTVSGDVSTDYVIKLAEKYFGTIPACPEVKPQTLAPVTIESDRYISYEDNIKAPQLSFTWPSVASHAADEAPLDVLADILSGSKSSILYQNFIKSEIAQSASAENSTSELVGDFSITVRAFQDKKLSLVDSIIRASLVQFEKLGVTDDDLKKFKAGFETQMVNSLSSVQGKGRRLAANQTFTGNPNYIVKEIEQYNKVTKEDVMRVYNKYIKGKHAVILSVYPKGKAELAARKDNYTPPARNTNVAEAAEYKGLVYKKAKDNFDRNIQPTPGPAPLVKVPDYWTENFGNGIKLIGAMSDEVPTVSVQLTIEAGHRYEDKSKAGISNLVTSMLNESTTKHSAEAIGEKLDLLGSTVNVSNTGQDIVLYISSLKKNLDSTLAIAEEILFHPKFDSKDFERVKKQKLEAISNQATQATTIANNVFNRLMYGDKHVMSVPTLGTKETVSAITLEQVKKYYEDHFSPSISTIVVVGDITKDAVIPKLAFLKKWTGPMVSMPLEPTMPTIDKTKIYFVNKDKAPQSEIRIGYMAMPYDATGEFYKSSIMNYILGGAFNSHINMNLREDKGWTYGARSSFSGSKYVGPFTASAGVRGNATDSSVIEFMKEMRNYAANGIKPDELQFTKNSMGQSDALKYETAQQRAGFIKRILDYKLDKSYVDKQNEILKNINVEEINILAKKHLPADKMVILVVGDKAKTFDKLTKLGYEVIELDTDGNPLAKADTGTQMNNADGQNSNTNNQQQQNQPQNKPVQTLPKPGNEKPR